MNNRLRAMVLAVATLSSALATTMCERKSVEDPDKWLKIGEQQVLAAQWHSAMRPLRQCLLLDPDNSGAHYYLGRAYLHARNRRSLPPWRLTVALGELETALACFHAHGRSQPLERFTPDQFEVICYITMAQVHLRKLEFGVSMGLPLSSLSAVIEELQAVADAARAIMPDSQDVRYLDSLIAKIQGFEREVETPAMSPMPLDADTPNHDYIRVRTH